MCRRATCWRCGFEDSVQVRQWAPYKCNLADFEFYRLLPCLWEWISCSCPWNVSPDASGGPSYIVALVCGSTDKHRLRPWKLRPGLNTPQARTMVKTLKLVIYLFSEFWLQIWFQKYYISLHGTQFLIKKHKNRGRFLFTFPGLVPAWGVLSNRYVTLNGLGGAHRKFCFEFFQRTILWHCYLVQCIGSGWVVECSQEWSCSCTYMNFWSAL
jgi:hypothetical protein